MYLADRAADPVRGHILAGLSDCTGDSESFQVLLERPGAKIERIVSPPGFSTPPGEWMEETTEEFVLVLEGRAQLEMDGGAILDLTPGDHLQIPAGCRHRVAATDEHRATIWLAVHC